MTPRTANGRYDFLYSPSWGEVELYDPKRHGVWSIARDRSGKPVLVVDSQRPSVASAEQAISERPDPTLPDYPKVTRENLEEARRAFDELEPRDLFYRAATLLVRQALERAVELTVAEALSVLLRTWNASYYRFHRFDARHLAELEQLIAEHLSELAAFRARSMETLGPDDEETLVRVFECFERVQGPVGAAKALHLLAPRFLPLWDREIAEAYGMPLDSAGTNGGRYYLFALITREQCRAVGWERGLGRNPLKAIDEYNYCCFTRRWAEG